MFDIREAIQGLEVTLLFPDARKFGRTWKMLCPFHEEKTPSFVIYPDELRFHCFGCHEDGSWIDYVIKRGWAADFMEAVNYLRRLAGMPEMQSANPLKKKIFEMNRKAAIFYMRKLAESKEAMAYLEQRMFTGKDTEEFKVGYAPGGDQTARYLLSCGYTKEDIKAAGLAVEAKGSFYDYFRNRIMFPVFYEESIYGFSGRIIGNAKMMKYKNSPDTVVFHKGRLLYGFSPRGIKAFGYAIVTEGQPDVISMHRVGFDNASAPMGTAFTPMHARSIKRHTNNVTFLFDGDGPGEKATLRAIEICISEGLNVRAGVLPSGEDPDSLIVARGEGAIAEVIDAAEMAEVFMLKRNKNERIAIITKIAASRNISVDVLPHLQGPERAILQEASAKTVMEMIRPFGRVLHRSNGLEIRRWPGLLIVYLDDQYLLWQTEMEDTHKQAHMIARAMKSTLNSMRKGAC